MSPPAVSHVMASIGGAVSWHGGSRSKDSERPKAEAAWWLQSRLITRRTHEEGTREISRKETNRLRVDSTKWRRPYKTAARCSPASSGDV